VDRVNAAAVIAIVDDDPSVRRSLVRVVTSAGYEAVAFASAPEFLAWLSAGRAACLVLDIHMAGTSGFELQERLSVPVIFITAHDDASIRARIAKSGAAGDLKKPFGAGTLLDAISRVTKGARVDQGPIGRPGDVGETEYPDKEAQ
jgi:FixJ family two-component response regulator